MTGGETDAEAIERIKLLRPVQDWATFRDAERWDDLRGVYARDATMAVSWFDGLASDFVDRCMQSAGNGMVAHHVMSSSQVVLAGSRAAVETRVTIAMRLPVHGVPCDVTAVGRFFDRLERQDGPWQIAARVAVFDKDMIQPVFPSDHVELDRATLDGFPPGYRYCCYTLAARGGVPNLGLPAPGSPALDALRAATNNWIHAG